MFLLPGSSQFSTRTQGIMGRVSLLAASNRAECSSERVVGFRRKALRHAIYCAGLPFTTTSCTEMVCRPSSKDLRPRWLKRRHWLCTTLSRFPSVNTIAKSRHFSGKCTEKYFALASPPLRSRDPSAEIQRRRYMRKQEKAGFQFVQEGVAKTKS